VCLSTAYDEEREANITMTYVPAHLYYMLFELMKVSKLLLLIVLFMSLAYYHMCCQPFIIFRISCISSVLETSQKAT